MFGMDFGFRAIDDLPHAHWNETEFSHILYEEELIRSLFGTHFILYQHKKMATESFSQGEGHSETMTYMKVLIAKDKTSCLWMLIRKKINLRCPSIHPPHI